MMPLYILLSFALVIVIGAWCFRDRATHPDGTPVRNCPAT